MSQSESLARRFLDRTDNIQAASICNQIHHNAYIVVETKALTESIIELSWRFNQPYVYARFNIYGYRNEQGFHSDVWSKETNGTLIVDTASNGSTHENLREGREYFYTFLISRMTNGFPPFIAPREQILGGLRFKLYMPASPDVAKRLEHAIQVRNYEKQFQHLDAPPVEPPSRREVALKQMLEMMHTEREMRDALRIFAIEEENKIRRMRLSPAAEEEELKALAKTIKYASLQFLKT